MISISINKVLSFASTFVLLMSALILIFCERLDRLFADKGVALDVVRKKRRLWGVLMLFFAVLSFLSIIFEWSSINPKW